MKLCKDCKWYQEPNACVSPKNGGKVIVSPVDGELTYTERRWYTCSVQRTHWFAFDAILFWSCGSRARWFEPKAPS